MFNIHCYTYLWFADHGAEGRTAATPCYWLGCRNFCNVVAPGFQLVKCGSSANTKVIDGGGCAKEWSLTSLQVLQCSFWCCDRALDMCYFEKHRHQLQWLRGKAAFSNPRVVRQAGLPAGHFSMAQIQKIQTQFGSEPTREDTESSVHHEKSSFSSCTLAGPLSAFCLTFSKKKVSGLLFLHPKQLLVWPAIYQAHGLCTKALPPKHGGWESEATAWPFIQMIENGWKEVKHWLEMPEVVARCCELCHLWFCARLFESFGLVRNELLRHLLRFWCLAGCLLVIGNLPRCAVTQEFQEHHRIDTRLLGIIVSRSLFTHFSLYCFQLGGLFASRVLLSFSMSGGETQ